MDIGTGKDLKEYGDIPYHLIDVVSPKSDFNVAKYQKLAYKAINSVLSYGKLPILVGGTGLYIDAITKGYSFDNIQYSISNIKKIRQKLNQLSLMQLLAKLRKIDLTTYNKIDKKNRRRVQRALEIYYISGQRKSESDKISPPDYEILFLGKTYPLPKLYQQIDSRLEDRIKEGMIEEIKKLRRSGVNWKRLDEFGLEYRYVNCYVRGLISYEELIKQLQNAIHHFAKRQMTLFKRNPQIIWVKSDGQAESLLKKFLA